MGKENICILYYTYLHKFDPICSDYLILPLNLQHVQVAVFFMEQILDNFS